MNKFVLKKLLSIEGYPAVSIFLPTHRTHPDSQQNPIRIKNLIKHAKELLLSRSSKREVGHLLKKLDELINKIDDRHTRDGLAIFVHEDYSGIFHLPFPVEERVVIDKTFATRDIVFALNRSPRYWVLVLSEKPTRLYQGFRDDIEEIIEGEFPMYHLGPGGAESLPGGFGIKKSAIRDEYDRKFFRHVDEEFSQYASADPLPLILAGVDRNLAFFMEVSSNKHLLLDTLKGSYDSSSSPELASLVWPIIEMGLAKKRLGALQELEEAIGKKNFASGIDFVWIAAKQGRGELLLVEQNFHFPASLDAGGFLLAPADDPGAPNVIGDAVDELIETVLAKQGRVIFLDDGALTNHRRVAMVLRY